MAQNFNNAFLRTQPSVSATDRAFYLSMKDRLCKARAHSSEIPSPRSGDNDHAAAVAAAAAARALAESSGGGSIEAKKA